MWLWHSCQLGYFRRVVGILMANLPGQINGKIGTDAILPNRINVKIVKPGKNVFSLPFRNVSKRFFLAKLAPAIKTVWEFIEMSFDWLAYLLSIYRDGVNIWLLITMAAVTSVTRFAEISPFWQLLEGYFNTWQNFEPTFANYYGIGKLRYCCK